MALATNRLSANAQNVLAQAQINACDELMNKIRAAAGDDISESMLTTIQAFALEKMHQDLPDRAQVKSAFRLTKKQAGITHSVTPVASNGKTIDGFLVHADKLGKGGYSIVKKGWLLTKKNDQWQVTPTAIHKGLKEGKYQSSLELRLADGSGGVYFSEIQRHETLFEGATHPNVESSPLFYGWLDTKREYMVHALRQGDLLHKACPSSRILLSIAKEIASGLAFYHERNILFCDLKPQNVLLDDRGHAILSDSKEKKEGDSVTIYGTRSYYPWEYGEGKEQTRAWDVYALGVTLLDIKYTYLRNVVHQIPDKSTKKQELINKIDQVFSHTNLLVRKFRPKYLDRPTEVMQLHLWNRTRVIDWVSQNAILDQIHAEGGLKDESLPVVKADLKRLDLVIRELVNKDPKDRPSAQTVVNKL